MMHERDEQYAAELLAWSRELDNQPVTFEDWQERRRREVAEDEGRSDRALRGRAAASG